MSHSRDLGDIELAPESPGSASPDEEQPASRVPSHGQLGHVPARGMPPGSMAAGERQVPGEEWSQLVFNENGSLRPRAVAAAGTVVLLIVMGSLMIKNTSTIDSDPLTGKAKPFASTFLAVGIAAFCVYNYFKWRQMRIAENSGALPAEEGLRARNDEPSDQTADDEMTRTMAQIHDLNRQIEGMTASQPPEAIGPRTRELYGDLEEDVGGAGEDVELQTNRHIDDV